jgi:ABC-type transport system substrate-binding protein/ABC-type amino acid transport substrate-binding protein
MKPYKFVSLLAIVVVASLILTACPAPTPAVIEVPKEVVVEKEVIQTVEVVKEVPIEKVVKETVEVEVPVEVEKEVIVVATPVPVGTLVVGTNAEFPPFEYVDENGEIVGFDMDLFEAIAEAAGFEYEFVNTRWDGIFVALASGEFDAVISGATITEERKETVDFSAPYFNAGQMVTVRADNTDIMGPEDLPGHTVGVQLGTTGDIAATEIVGDDMMKRYDEYTLAFQGLAQGDVDAVVCDSPTSAEIVSANPELNLKIVGDAFTDELYGIAVIKDRPEVLAAINTGLATVRGDGTYNEIYRKWFEAEPEDPCAYGGEFQAIEAVDDLTVQFTLCYPDPAFPSKIAFSAFPINDSEYLEATGGEGDLVFEPIGTGPYMLEEWNQGAEVVMKRFDDYWGEPAIAENLIFRWNTEAAARLVELQAGTIDGMDNPGSDDFAVIEGDPNLALYERAGTNIFYLGMNNWYPPFDNERVRQAFAMAIDKQRLVDNFYPRGSLAASQFMPPVIFGYTPEVEWWEYNPEMAQQILEEEGVLPGFQTTITYRDVVRSYLPEPGVVAQDIQAQLAAIGVDLEIVVMESGAFLDASDAGEIDGFHMLGWGADYPDATNFLDFHFGSGATDQFGDGFEDIWDALSRAAALADPDERYPIYIEANELIKQHVPMIPIAHGGSGTAFLADVEGAHSSPLGNEYFAVMKPGERDTIVWMQNAEPLGLYCADETDGESLRPCEQIHEPLLTYEVGGTAVRPSLATSCEANEDLTIWTCFLREGVKFHNGATLDAGDVVRSYEVQWDASDPLHTGRRAYFSYFSAFFGGFKNVPEEAEE